MRRWALLALVGFLTAACAQTPSPQPRHVFLIVMENHSEAEALSQPFTASLAQKYGVATNYHAITHPSVPNYLALTSGSTWGVQDDSYHVLPKKDLGTQLTNAHVSWAAYMEGMQPGRCLDSPLPYDPGHNPFMFYGGQCPANVVPLTDLGGQLPRFVWITPDACHDTHSCGLGTGDVWLSREVAQMTATSAWDKGGVLFITWDEDDNAASNNHVLTLVIEPGMAHRASTNEYTHYSLLATIEDLLGVARLGKAAGATPMTDLLPA